MPTVACQSSISCTRQDIFSPFPALISASAPDRPILAADCGQAAGDPSVDGKTFSIRGALMATHYSAPIPVCPERWWRSRITCVHIRGRNHFYDANSSAAKPQLIARRNNTAPVALHALNIRADGVGRRVNRYMKHLTYITADLILFSIVHAIFLKCNSNVSSLLTSLYARAAS